MTQKAPQKAPKDPLRDFRNFLWAIWKHLGLPPPTRRQYAIAMTLAARKHRRLIIQGFRGIGKSWITAAFVLWLLYTEIEKNPQLNIMVVSASKKRADNFTIFLRRLIDEVEFLQHLRPREGQRDALDGFDVGPSQATQTPTVVSMGITSAMTGNRADWIIPDDVEVPGNSATVSMRDKLREAVKEFDAILKPNGRIVGLGTPQDEDSLYIALLEAGYKTLKWPSEYPSEAEMIEYGDQLAPDILEDLKKDPSLVGHSTEPTRFTDEELLGRRVSYGRRGYGLQFKLLTSFASEMYPLRQSDLMVYPLVPDGAPERMIWAGSEEYIIKELEVVGLRGDRLYRPFIPEKTGYLPFTGTVMAIDPAGRGKDETGWAIVGILHNTLYLLDAGGERGYEDPTLTKLAKKAAQWKVNQVIVEPNFGDGMFLKVFTPFLKTTWPCLLTESERSNAQKERRICDTLEPVMSGHRLVVNRSLVAEDFKSTDHYPAEIARQYQLFYQMTRITREKGSLNHDDRLDAVALAVAHWTQQMGRSQEEASKATQKRLMDAEIKKFRKGIREQRTMKPDTGVVWAKRV